MFINDILKVVEAAGQWVNVGESELPGLLFTNDFAGVSDNPEGLQMQIDAAMEFARNWRLSGNAKKCAVMVRNDSRIEEKR